MRIGDRYSDNRVYRGIKYSDNLPLIADDLHEFSDTLAAKNNYLLESILGSGILRELTPTISSTHVKLNTPAVLNIEGDICLIGNSANRNLIENSRLSSSGRSTVGTIFVVGWYQNITANDSIREYGGRMNEILPNNLIYPPLGIQVSSRYQFVWDVSVYEGELPEDGFTINLVERDEDGVLLNASYPITPTSKVGSIYKATPPSSMSYVVDDLYLIPLFKYEYDPSTNTFSTISTYPIRRTSSSMTLIESDKEPSGLFSTGTVWYNPVNREFKTYIEGTGFVENSVRMGFIQYQYINIASNDSMTPMDLLYNIDVPTLQENDIFNVTYEGIQLIRDTDYTIDIDNKTITLLNFTRLSGEKLVVNVSRLVEATNVTSITSMVVSHIDSLGDDNNMGHVKLSDSTNSDSGITEGIAATPKAVKSSKILTDETTGTKYQLVVSDNSLYIENMDTNERKPILNLV